MIKFIDLRAQYDSIKNDVNAAIQKVLDSTNFILGENVREFDIDFARFCNSKHSVGVNSGTSALHLALVAKGIGRGDEVITVPNTFIATCAAIYYTGATPKFVDINQETYNLDSNKLEKTITPQTKAIIPVHLYGQSADMKHIKEIADKHNITIIEDACQAHGATHYGKIMPYSDVGCFSFYPAKNLGSYGEGGSVISNDNEFAEKLKAYRDHGQIKKNVHKYIGYNYRLEELQAAILRIKLKYLNNWTEMRRKNAKIYNEMIENSDVIRPIEKEYNKHVYHLYVIRTKSRQKIINNFNLKNIQFGIHYPTPIHLQKAFSHMDYKKGSFPVAEKYADEILSLPMYPELTQEQILQVCNAIKEAL